MYIRAGAGNVLRETKRYIARIQAKLLKGRLDQGLSHHSSSQRSLVHVVHHAGWLDKFSLCIITSPDHSSSL